MNAIKLKVAAGIIIFRRLGNRLEYLLLQTSYGKNHWTPPKGHVDPGEDEMATAKRETLEESGLTPSHYKIMDNFKETLNYNVNDKPKIVHYWLAQIIDPNTPIILSDEHIAYRWGDLNETKNLSGFQDMNDCFDRAEQFITSQAG